MNEPYDAGNGRDPQAAAPGATAFEPRSLAARAGAPARAMASGAPAPPGLATDPVIESFKRTVDRTRLRLNLERSVEERLRNLMELQRFADQVGRAVRTARPSRATDLEELLRRLAKAGVEHIMVGGVAAVAHGGSRLTHQLDLVYRRRRDNLERLAAALAPVLPCLRGATGGLPFRLDLATLERGTSFSLSTSHGDIDLLREGVGGGDYEDLLPHSAEVDAFGISCRLLGLEALIRAHRAAGHPSDLETAAELELLLAAQPGG